MSPAIIITEGLKPTQLGRLNAALDTRVRIDGTVTTWRAFIAAEVVSKRESDGMADYSRTRVNRMNGREQDAYMARLKAKRVFILSDAEGYGRAVPKLIYDAVTFADPGEAQAAADWTDADSVALFGEA